MSYDLVHSLSSLLMQSVTGPFDRIELFVCSRSFFLSGDKSVVDPRVCFVCRQRCSHRDQFVVILVVTLLLNVVFNDSTIYGQKK